MFNNSLIYSCRYFKCTKKIRNDFSLLLCNNFIHFHNGRPFKYSVMCILISLAGLVCVSTIQKNLCFITRPAKLIMKVVDILELLTSKSLAFGRVKC